MTAPGRRVFLLLPVIEKVWFLAFILWSTGGVGGGAFGDNRVAAWISPSSSLTTKPGHSSKNFGTSDINRPTNVNRRWIVPSRSSSSLIPCQALSDLLASHFLTTATAAATGMPPPPSPVTAASTSGNVYLWNYFWETVISNGVPAALTLTVILITAFLFRPNRQGTNIRALEESVFGQKNPASILYQDLYGDQEQDIEAITGDGSRRNTRNPFFRFFFPRNAGGGGGGGNRDGYPSTTTLQNIGIPSDQYIRVTCLNRKYDSYQYSLTAGTVSRAAAAANYRSQAFQRIWSKVALANPTDMTLLTHDDETAHSPTTGTATAVVPPQPQPGISLAVWRQLQRAEQELLSEGSLVLAELQAMETELTKMVVDYELQEMGVLQKAKGGRRVFQLDPAPPNRTVAMGSTMTNETTLVSTSEATNVTTGKKLFIKRGGRKKMKKSFEEVQKKIAQLQRELQELELDFIQNVVEAVGPANAVAFRAAILGDAAIRGGGGAGNILRDLKDRPLSALLANNGQPPPRLFVCSFPGDATASQVSNLREEVTAIVQGARPGVDEALVILQTGGGTVTGYGLAASQLLRFKSAGMKLTVAVEQVAASGGYMMCCVADHIVASPFAVLGSIGVITDIPNVYERLKQEGIEFQTVTAGKYKRTLTPTKKVTREDFAKTKEDVEEILVLFRDFVAQQRPVLDINAVATGETWFGTAALERKLCDEIKPVDDVLIDYVRRGYDVYEVEYSPPIETLFGKVQPAAQARKTESGGPIAQGIRYLIRTVVDEVTNELRKEFDATGKPIQERYMMIDDSSDRIKTKS